MIKKGVMDLNVDYRTCQQHICNHLYRSYKKDYQNRKDKQLHSIVLM